MWRPLEYAPSGDSPMVARALCEIPDQPHWSPRKSELFPPRRPLRQLFPQWLVKPNNRNGVDFELRNDKGAAAVTGLDRKLADRRTIGRH